MSHANNTISSNDVNDGGSSEEANIVVITVIGATCPCWQVRCVHTTTSTTMTHVTMPTATHVTDDYH